MDDQTYRMALDLRNRLRAELEQNETYRALQHAEAVVALWERARPSTPGPSVAVGPTPQPTSPARRIPGSKAARINEGAAEYLRTKGSRATSGEIYRALVPREIEIKGKDPLKIISSYLSHSKLFNNAPGQGYGLAEWPITSAEAQRPASTKPPTKADQMWSAVASFLRSRGIAHRQEILGHLISIGLLANTPNAIKALAPFLSDRKRFLIQHGQGRWSLASDVEPATATRSSGELFGPPKLNSAPSWQSSSEEDRPMA